MKRYFTFRTPPDPAKYNPRGGYHYMSLPGSGYVCVLMDESADPSPDWAEMPHLMEATAANFNGINTTSGAYVSAAQAPAPSPIAGIAHTDTTFQVAKKLAALNRLFQP